MAIQNTYNNRKPVDTGSIFLFSILIAVAGILIVYAFSFLRIENTSLGTDWAAIYAGLKNGVIRFDTGMKILPWDVPLLLPFGFLSFTAGWGLTAFLTLATLIISVPNNNRKLKIISLIFLLTCYQLGRELMDGNVEWMIITGALLIAYAYKIQKPILMAAGLLLVTGKIQESWLLAIGVSYILWQNWPKEKIVQLVTIMAAVIIPSLLWIGQPWLVMLKMGNTYGTVIDMSLFARFHSIPVLFIISWLIVLITTILVYLKYKPDITRNSIGVLMIASMLLSPYISTTSMLVILSIEIIPLFFKKPILGLILLAMLDIPYFVSRFIMFDNIALYYMAILIIAWTSGLWEIKRDAIKASQHELYRV